MNILNRIRKKIIRNEIKKQIKEISPILYPIDHTEPQDIFICGYPKSGNTWMQNLMAGIIYGISTEYLPDKLTQELVPDVHYRKYYARHLDFAVFKSHNLPMPNYKKVIHLIRDGRDAMISYYAMNKALGINNSLEEMVLEGKGITQKWYEHTQAWIDNPFNADILIVKYEDLQANPLSVMQKVCAFIGIERSESLINRSINGNSFIQMQKKEQEFGWHNTGWKKEEKFIRKGKIGSYKDEMPFHLIAYFEKEAHNQLKMFGY
jgi:hypothetical protein